MPSTSSSTTLLQQAGNAPAGAGVSPGRVASGMVTRLSLLRALGAAVLVLAVVGAALGALLFGIGTLPMASLSYYLVGLFAAALAALVTVALHGRFAATPAPLGGQRLGAAGGDSFLVTGRLQSLLAAAFAVKVIVLVLGIVVMRQVSLPVFGEAATPLSDAGDSSPKFSDVATFAVTFAGAALLCQLTTAFALSRSLRRPTASQRAVSTSTS